MADAAGEQPPAVEQDRKKMVKVTKWNAVAMWSWDVQVDTCAICRNHIGDMCIECQSNSTGDRDLSGMRCDVAWGDCGHCFHHHCISHWHKTRQTCPTCDNEWQMANLESNANT